MTTNLRKQKTITAIFWSVIAVMLLAMGIYAIRDLPMRLGMKVSPSLYLAIEVSTDNTDFVTVFKNHGQETLGENVSRTVKNGNEIFLTGSVFNEIYSNEPIYIRITNYTQASDVNDILNYANGPALNAYFTAENGVTNYPSYGLENIAPYNGINNPSAKTFVVVPQTVIMDSKYEFNLKLELSNFVATEYTVTQTLGEGITSLNNFSTTKAIPGHDFETKLISNDNNYNPHIYSIFINGVQIVQNEDYEFNVATGVLKIYGESINGNVVINAIKSVNKVNVTFSPYAHSSMIFSYNNTDYVAGNNFQFNTTKNLIITISNTDNVQVAPNIMCGTTDITSYCTISNFGKVVTIPVEKITDNLTINCSNYWSGYASTSFAGGNGTSETPYQITTPEQLALLASIINTADGNTFSGYSTTFCRTAYYELKNDIYLNNENFSYNEGAVIVFDGINTAKLGTGINGTTSGTWIDTYSGSINSWIPIGNDTLSFSGHFDGNDNKISGLYINNTSLPKQGVWGYTNNASIQNISFVNSNIMAGSNMGFIGTSVDSTVANCVADDCYMFGNDNNGGVVGNNTGSNFTNCYTINSVIGGSNSAGGVAGYMASESVLTSCYSNNVKIISVNYAGGLIGSNYLAQSITGCYATNIEITPGGDYTGGLIGGNISAEISDCYSSNIKITSSGNYTGGLIGVNSNCEISDCYSSDIKITSSGNYVGGLIGDSSNASIINCNTQDIECRGNSCVGGFCGSFIGETAVVINNCFSKNVIVETESHHIGGFCGYISKSNIKIINCYVENAKLHGGGEDIAGFAGNNYGVIENCYTNDIELYGGNYDIGGFVGENLGKIRNCYTTNVVIDSVANRVGYFVGWNHTMTAVTAELINCYSLLKNDYEFCGETTNGVFTGCGTFSGCYAGIVAITGCTVDSSFTRIYIALNSWVTANQTDPATYRNWPTNANYYPYFV